MIYYLIIPLLTLITVFAAAWVTSDDGPEPEPEPEIPGQLELPSPGYLPTYQPTPPAYGTPFPDTEPLIILSEHQAALVWIGREIDQMCAAAEKMNARWRR